MGGDVFRNVPNSRAVAESFRGCHTSAELEVKKLGSAMVGLVCLPGQCDMDL